MTRHEERIKAMEIIYLMELRKLTREEIVKIALELDKVNIEGTFAMEIIDGVAAKRDKLEKILNVFLPQNFKFARQNNVDKAILLIGSWEIMSTNTDTRAIIDESIKLAKVYCAEESYKYINAVLDNISKKKRA